MTERRAPLSERDRALRKREWLRIYIPIGMGAALALALVIVVAALGFKQGNLGGDPASAWGDAAALIVILQVMMITIPFLVLFIALCVLMFKLINWSHPLLRQGQEIAATINEKVSGASDSMVAAAIKPSLSSARMSAVIRFLRRSNV